MDRISVVMSCESKMDNFYECIHTFLGLLHSLSSFLHAELFLKCLNKYTNKK